MYHPAVFAVDSVAELRGAVGRVRGEVRVVLLGLVVVRRMLCRGCGKLVRSTSAGLWARVCRRGVVNVVCVVVVGTSRGFPCLRWGSRVVP